MKLNIQEIQKTKLQFFNRMYLYYGNGGVNVYLASTNKQEFPHRSIPSSLRSSSILHFPDCTSKQNWVEPIYSNQAVWQEAIIRRTRL